jgi:hypothetical protein
MCNLYQVEASDVPHRGKTSASSVKKRKSES